MSVKLAEDARVVRVFCLKKLTWMIIALLCAIVLNVPTAEGQRTRFDDFFQVLPGNTSQPAQPAPVIRGPVFGGQALPGLPGNQPLITTTPPPAVIQTPNILTGPTNTPAPVFDPFQTPNNPFPAFPQAQQQPFQLYPAPNNQPIFGQATPPRVVVPPTQQFQILPPQQQAYQPQPQGQFQAPYINNQWPYNAPGSSVPNSAWAWPNQVWARLKTQVVPRLLERPRFRHTWLEGDEDHELDINDTEIATTMTFANWLGTSQPLRVSPGFIFHFWDGPDTFTTGYDLPSKAYSVYLGTEYSTDTRRNFGIETNLTIGVYSDFNNTSSDAIRITGTGLGWRRLNSYTTFKMGVEYLDRVDVKILPAVGLFLTPNPDLMLNLYFPRPKLSQRLPQFGPFEVWGYMGAEYGGGTWAIERTPLMGANFNDQVDINDVRAFIGTEWMGPRRVTGFFEIGYAFDREMLYASDHLNKLELQDTFMLRTGMAF